MDTYYVKRSMSFGAQYFILKMSGRSFHLAKHGPFKEEYGDFRGALSDYNKAMKLSRAKEGWWVLEHIARVEIKQENFQAAGFNIQAVVLQDHGFGDNWTKFGGDSDLYKGLKEKNLLPEILFVACNTSLWPTYQSIDAMILIQRGQYYHFERTIFVRPH